LIGEQQGCTAGESGEEDRENDAAEVAIHVPPPEMSGRDLLKRRFGI
jgi:hypothetical protein